MRGVQNSSGNSGGLGGYFSSQKMEIVRRRGAYVEVCIFSGTTQSNLSCFMLIKRFFQETTTSPPPHLLKFFWEGGAEAPSLWKCQLIFLLPLKDIYIFEPLLQFSIDHPWIRCGCFLKLQSTLSVPGVLLVHFNIVNRRKWKSSLLYVFWWLTLHKTSQIQKVIMCTNTTNQWKQYDYVTHPYSMSFKQKVCSVKYLPT